MTRVVIENEHALAAYRATDLAASAVAPTLLAGGTTLVNAPVGVGKSHLLDDLLDTLLVTRDFDLIIVLAALTASLLERRLLKHPHPDVIRLRPRPRADCGPLDDVWRQHERHGTTTYAKEYVCGRCPLRPTCFWPAQYGSAKLAGAKIIFATHTHLRINRRFALHLKTMTGASTVLLVLDEADILASSFRTRFSTDVLKGFVAAVEHAGISPRKRNQWLRLTQLLLVAGTRDLQGDGWHFPLPSVDDTLAIQEAGITQNLEFRWPGHDLYAFGSARPDRRWRDTRGNVVFAQTPYLANSTIILSAGMNPLYVRRQLGLAEDEPKLPLPPVHVQHRNTRIYNLCSLLGAASRFPGNHKQILDVFAQLIKRNIDMDRLTLLVARKRFKAFCAKYLQDRLAGWGVTVTIVPSKGEALSAPSPTTVPMIHYGINGINTFEGYDAAYCLTGYYIDEDNLRDAIADQEDDALRFPVSIQMTGEPPRRQAGTFAERYAASNADAVARAYYHQLETNVVIQAVGRVRFFTKPREIILFQGADIPGVALTQEFYSLREMRDHFGLVPGAEFDRRRQVEQAHLLRTQGLSTKEIATRLAISERTVRYRLTEQREEAARG